MFYYYFIIILFVLLIYVYLKLKYKFWYYQPVFHLYDIFYYFFPPGIINLNLPDKNKFTNFENIKTFEFNKISDIQLESFINFIQSYYLNNNNNIFKPLKENIIPYFTGHNYSSHISFYHIDEVLHNVKNDTIINNKKLISVITSRPLQVSILNTKKNDMLFYVNYVDYLCVNNNYRKKGISPEIIQTHHYNIRHLNKKIVVSLFKREGELTGIVPLCIYKTYGFKMSDIIKPSLLSIYKIIECNSNNYNYLLDFIQKQNNLFNICIFPEIFNVLELIKTLNYYIYILIDITNNNVLSTFFFRKTCVTIEKNKYAIACFASIKCNSITDDLFINAFYNSLFSIKYKYEYLIIEELSHNIIISNNLKKNINPFMISPTAYFFYNFAYNTFNANETLIIC